MRLSFSLALLCAASVPTFVAATSFVVTVRDAASGSNLSSSSGLTCALYDESNALVVSSSGSCTLAVPYCSGDTCPRVFRLAVSKAGYYPTSKSGLQLSNTAVSVQLSSKLTLSASTEQLRVVLSWGDTHSDLDSYMIVPPAMSSGSTCTVNYAKPNCAGVAALDVDDTDFYGPETTTLTNPHAGTYSYLVNIYGGNGICWDDGIKARVEVWGSKSGGLIKALPQPLENKPPRCKSNDPPPAKTCHQYWHVFDLDATTNEFTWVNKMVPNIQSAAAARSAGKSMAAYLPSSASCVCNTYPGAGSQMSWTSKATSIASTLATALLGNDGVAGKATCYRELQDAFTAATPPSGSKGWTDAATDAVDGLAAKISARFEARKAIATSMRDRAKAIYGGSHAGGSGGATMCEDTCNACYFDASFKTSVNRNSYGLRFGAKATAAGTSAHDIDVSVVNGLGEMAKDTFAEHPTTKCVRPPCFPTLPAGPARVYFPPHAAPPPHRPLTPPPPFSSFSGHVDGSTWAPKKGSTLSPLSGRAQRRAVSLTIIDCGRGTLRRQRVPRTLWWSS